MPSAVKCTKEQVLRWWDHWLLWRMTGKRIEAFVLATDWKGVLPRSMLDTFFELDDFFGRMEAQRLEKELEELRRRAR